MIEYLVLSAFFPETKFPAGPLLAALHIASDVAAGVFSVFVARRGANDTISCGAYIQQTRGDQRMYHFSPQKQESKRHQSVTDRIFPLRGTPPKDKNQSQRAKSPGRRISPSRKGGASHAIIYSCSCECVSNVVTRQQASSYKRTRITFANWSGADVSAVIKLETPQSATQQPPLVGVRERENTMV